MGPLSSKLVHELAKAKRSKVVDLSAVRDARAMLQATGVLERDSSRPGDVNELAGLPPNHRAFMQRFKVLASLAHALLATKTLRQLAERIEAAETHYMPGGPPLSPIFDSVFMSFWMADLPVGPSGETMCSMLADIGSSMDTPDEVTQAALVLSRSRLGVYRVTPLATDRVQLDDLFTAQRVIARVPRDLRGRGPLWLTRLLPPLLPAEPDWVVWTTPYELDGPQAQAQWLAYAERLLAGVPPEQRADRVARHFKAADEPARFLEYIMDAYAGVTPQGVVVLNGVPDRPQTLPHAASHGAEHSQPAATSALDRVKQRLQEVACEQDPARFDSKPPAAERARSFPEAAELLALAYCMYGQLDAEGRSAPERLQAREHELAADERRALNALLAGWFSAFEVVHIRVDEGMELRDRLSRRRFWLTERSGTRQVQLGELLVGWVMVEDGKYLLEGSVCRVPAMLAQAYATAMRDRKNALARQRPKLGWRKRNGLLARGAVELLERVYAESAPPVLLNSDGDELLLSAARYDVADRARAARLLGERFESDGDGVYRYLVDGHLTAVLQLRGRTLTVECNSKARLQRMKALLREWLGDTVVHRVDVHEDLRAAAGRQTGGEATVSRQASELPPEARAQVQAMIVEHMRKWLDEPIPMLNGKTPRQAVRSSRGRDDVTHMLTQQQRIFDAGPGMPPIDLREIWQALGLEPR